MARLRRRNADEGLRALERAARASGAPDDLAAMWSAMVRAGAGTGDATLAVVNAGGVSSLPSVLSRLLEAGAITPRCDRDDFVEAIRRATKPAPDGLEYCESNECDRPECHRCFPREGCGLCAKCREFTRAGTAEVIEIGAAKAALAWLVLQRALADADPEWRWGSGPELHAIADSGEVAMFAWIAWADELIETFTDMTDARRSQVREAMHAAARTAWGGDYRGALSFVRGAEDLILKADDDAFTCSRCERRRYRYGRTRCGRCDERFCDSCDTDGPSSHPGAHDCREYCSGCGEELPEDGDSDYCDDCRDDDEDVATENPYYGRVGSGLMLFSSDMRRVLLVLRSGEVAESGTWGNPGGKLESGSLYQSALREVGEELGRVPAHAVFGEVPYRDGDFTYTTFLAAVEPSEDEWEPALNWESDDASWFDVTSMPSDLHFGVQHIMRRKPELFR